jgi:uncharacterized protein YbjT (DUF2867 family)
MRAMQRIAIIGATGTVGREVVATLVHEGADVRAISRNPEAADLQAGVDVVRGDLTEPDTLDAALAGVDAAFLVWTAPAAAAPAAIERIAKHVPRLVFLSAPFRTPHPFFQQPNPVAAMHAELERLIDESGIRRTYIRPGMFAANAAMWWGSQIRSGDVVRWPYGEAPTAPIDERDIAAVAVRSLLDESRDGGDFVITGPESLTQREQVAAIGEVLGRSLRFEEMTPDEARRELQAPPAIIDMLLNAWSAALGQPAYVTATVEELTGRRARTFREWVQDHADAFR